MGQGVEYSQDGVWIFRSGTADMPLPLLLDRPAQGENAAWGKRASAWGDRPHWQSPGCGTEGYGRNCSAW